jgi:3-hydroxymyristoyl/3-hydroxydecanoyl-(acyl carrier protein) dehydratase
MTVSLTSLKKQSKQNFPYRREHFFKAAFSPGVKGLNSNLQYHTVFTAQFLCSEMHVPESSFFMYRLDKVKKAA